MKLVKRSSSETENIDFIKQNRLLIVNNVVMHRHGYNNSEYVAQWLDEDNTPFCVPVFDCRCRAIQSDYKEGSHSVYSSHQKFTKENFVGQLPSNATRFPLDFSFELDECLPDGMALFQPGHTGEKWFIFREGDLLYFVWEGTLMYLARIKECSDQLVIDLMVLNKQLIDPRDPLWHARSLYYLVRSHILEQVVPHPLPGYLPDNCDEILEFSYHYYGIKGLFAAYRYR
jgi:hypothetical protein